DQLLQRLVARCGELLHATHLTHALAHVVAQVFDRVELAGQLGELVVQFGQLLDLHAVHGDGDVGLLTLVLATHQGGAEGRLTACFHTAQGVVEPLEHGVGTHLVGVTADGNVLELFTVDRCGQVDGQVVTVLDGAVHTHQRGKALTQGTDLFVDLLVGDLGAVDGHLDALVVLHLELGADVD